MADYQGYWAQRRIGAFNAHNDGPILSKGILAENRAGDLDFGF